MKYKGYRIVKLTNGTHQICKDVGEPLDRQCAAMREIDDLDDPNADSKARMTGKDGVPRR